MDIFVLSMSSQHYSTLQRFTSFSWLAFIPYMLAPASAVVVCGIKSDAQSSNMPNQV